MKRLIVDLNVVTVAEWDKKKGAIKFLENVRENYEVYTPLTFLYRILRDWEYKKLADKVFRQYDIITYTFLQEAKATIISFEKLKLTLRELTDLIARNLKIKKEDAGLVAYATLFGLDILVTYNRKDLRDRKDEINEFLKKYNLKAIEIKAPEELLPDSKSSFNIPKSFLSVLPSLFLPFFSNFKSSFLSHNDKLSLELFKDLFILLPLTTLLVPVALATSNIPDILEDRASIAWSTENISDIAYSSLSYYDLKTDGYKIMPTNWTEAEGDFTGGLVGWWKFDENTGTTTADFSNKGNNGNLTNFDFNTTSGWVDGKYGKALRFDGVNDYVDVGSGASLSPSLAITVEAWIKPNVIVGTDLSIFGKLHRGNKIGYLFSQQGDDIRFEWADGTTVYSITSSANPLSANNWAYVLATYDGQYLRTYINGNLDGENDIGARTLNPQDQYNIGMRWGTSGPFNGTIDEVRIYNRALSADEIKLSYEKRKPGYQIAIQNITVSGRKYTPLGVQDGISYVNRAYNTTTGYVMYYPTTDDFRFSLNGSVVSTNDLLKSITYKGSTAGSTFASTNPVDSTIKVNNNITSSYGLGTTFIVTKGTKMTKGEVKVNMSSPNVTYDTVYQLYSGSDYLINTINTPLNVTRAISYYLGSSYVGDTFTIPGQTLAERCWNKSVLSSLYVCSADASQVNSPGIASGLIYEGGNSSFYEACFKNTTTATNQFTHYQFEITSKDKEDVLIPFVKGTCSNIADDMYLVTQGEKPKAFGTVESKEREQVIGIILKYKNIFINGSDRFPTGDYKLCVKKVNEDTSKRISYVEIRAC